MALESELDINVDMLRVLKMIAIHELEEIKIGDITPISKQNKSDLKDQARNAVYSIVKNLKKRNEFLNLTNEFNANETKEAKFAKAVDKLECVLEFKKYQDLGIVSLDNVDESLRNNKKVNAMIDSGKYDLADIFFLFHMPAYVNFGITEDVWYNTIKPLKIGGSSKTIKK